MNAPSSVVSQLARVVHLMRTAPDEVEIQRQGFLKLMDGLGDQDLAIGADVGGITVNGHALPQGTPYAAELHDQFSAHGIGLLTIPGAISPAPMMVLLRALARPRGEIRSATEFFGLLDAEGARLVTVRGPRELPRADHLIMLDRDPGGSPSSFNAAPADHALSDAPPPFWQEATSSRDALREIQVAADAAIRERDWPRLLDIMTDVVKSVDSMSDQIQQRRYRQVIQGMTSRPTIRALAQLSGEGTREKVSAILQGIGAEATVVLLDLMATAETIKARREYFTLLCQMRQGTGAIINRLADEKWFVVRNVAELCGELRLADAVPRLETHVDHPDARVRRAVAGALARIGTHQAAEKLRDMLHDPEPTVRLQAVQSLEGAKARGLSMTLAVLLDEERHPDVRRELHLALGRIGTNEAIQALVRSSKPGRALFGRKPTEIRLAAVEGLALCGGPKSAAALKELAGDRDTRVRDAARNALSLLETQA